MSKHTPGPWTVTDLPAGGMEITAGGHPVMRIRGSMTPRKADSHLIAAAPDLLQAAQMLLLRFAESTRDKREDAVFVESLRIAVSKATQ